MTTPAPTLRESVLKIVDTGRPELALSYPRTYAVRAVRGDGRLDLDPPPDAPDLQPLDAVEQWTMGGALTFPAVGSLVLVTFRDALATRAVVTGLAPVTPGAKAAKVGDHAGRLYKDSATGLLYYSPGEASAYALVTTAAGPPIDATPGTSVTISTGSDKVSIS